MSSDNEFERLRVDDEDARCVVVIKLSTFEVVCDSTTCFGDAGCDVGCNVFGATVRCVVNDGGPFSLSTGGGGGTV